VPFAPVGDGEIGALVSLAARLGVRTLVLGTGRDPRAREAAGRFARGWEARGGLLLGTVTWPEQAASWLRQARALTGPAPDAWVLGGPALGLAQVVRRLDFSTPWSARRTLGFGGTVGEAISLAGGAVAEGMRGANADGTLWHVLDGRVEPLHPAGIGRDWR
jgi:hypothetical protein